VVQVESGAEGAENEVTEADRGGGGDAALSAEQGVVGALRSLERTLAEHSQLLGKRLRRELTVKGEVSAVPSAVHVTAAAASSPAAAKTGLRGDKVPTRPPGRFHNVVWQR